MAYDETKDKTLASWQHESGLWVSVTQYNGGEPKLQIGPREFKKADGTPGYGKAGRLAMAEAQWLNDLMVNVMAEMTKGKKPL